MKFKDPKTILCNARDLEDAPYKQELPFYSVSEKGELQGKVLLDLETKNVSAFWQMHEPKLWGIIAVCGLYFLSVMVGA